MTKAEQIDEAVLNAIRSYLRTSRSGGMPKEQSDIVEAVAEDMARLNMFAFAVAEVLA